MTRRATMGPGGPSHNKIYGAGCGRAIHPLPGSPWQQMVSLPQKIFLQLHATCMKPWPSSGVQSNLPHVRNTFVETASCQGASSCREHRMHSSTSVCFRRQSGGYPGSRLLLEPGPPACTCPFRLMPSDLPSHQQHRPVLRG